MSKEKEDVVSVGMKKCSACLLEKPATLEFYKKAKRTADGFEHRCKVCIKAKIKAYKKPVREGYKVCNRCKEEKESTLNFFRKVSKNKDGLANICKDCKKLEQQLPENKVKRLERDRLPESKARAKELRETEHSRERRKRNSNKPKAVEQRRVYGQLESTKEKRKIQSQKPEVKAKRAARKKTPAYKKQAKEYAQRPENKARRNERNKERRKTEHGFSLYPALSRRLIACLTDVGSSKPRPTFNYVGCTNQELADHLNKGFYTVLDYMKNVKGNIVFHIDHIIPAKYFMDRLVFDTDGNVTSETEKWLYKGWNYRNLRVWPAPLNESKKDKMDYALIKQHGIEDLLTLD